MAFINKHTQGDWTNTGLEIRAINSMILANVYRHLPANQSIEEAMANAKLIAAAPKLRQLVEMFHDSLEAGFIKDMCVTVLTEAGVEITNLKSGKNES